MKLNYELLNIMDLPILMGKPDITVKDKGYPDKIFSFGAGKSTGEQTKLTFTLPLKYSGEAMINDRLFDLFLFPDEAFSGKDLFNADLPFYLMLEVIGDIAPSKWFLYHPKSNKVRTVKKVFNQ